MKELLCSAEARGRSSSVAAGALSGSTSSIYRSESTPAAGPVFLGGRGHRQITQNRLCKKKMCGVKLAAVKVAVGGH